MQKTAEFIEKTNKAYLELKRRLDSLGSAENKEVVEKIQDELDALEEINQKFVKESMAQKNISDALLFSNDGYKQTNQFKAFMEFIKTGSKGMIHALPEVEMKQLMRTDSGIDGGFLVPEALDNELRREVFETSNIRSISRVKTMENKTLNVPVRKADSLTASFEGETEAPGADDAPTFREVAVIPFRQTVTIPMTQDMVMDAGFDLEAEVRTDVGFAFAQNEGRFHVIGDGVKKPEGFAQNAIIQGAARVSETAEAITGDDILNMMEDIKEGYDGVFVFNRAVLRIIRTLKDSSGSYVFQPAFTGGSANSIVGAPFLLAKDMQGAATLVAGTFPVAFGDFRRGYEVFDRTGTLVIRDVYTKKGKAIIELTFHRWTTGRVVIPEAIALLKVKA